ncbi:MAG: 30S ribosomal protein S4 [Candidatus Eisenbacteria bacterium]|nr:30S ribosomal protein S4 [Candidatus Eisenbacteria bacterium]
MARYREGKCRLCRRESEKLFLKGDRCFTDHCAIDKRNFVPGEHGKGGRRRRETGYGLQLREKQKARRIYGIMERQFRNYFLKAEGMKGKTGEILLQLLETRLDNVVYRMGLAPSRNAARQLVRHRHLKVNNRVVNVPSRAIRAGDEVAVREKSKTLKLITSALESQSARGLPQWLEVSREDMKGRLVQIPSRTDIPVAVQEQFIVELYSK